MVHKRRVLFHRTWTKPNGGTSGGQMKVRDAFEHFRHSPHFEPFVFFPKETVWHPNPGNVWWPYRDQALPEWDIRPSDVLFLAGTDWLVMTSSEREHPPVPVLNIVHPRHTRPEDPRHAFLRHPAIRIAKSSAGMEILREYGVNGPLFLIPDAIDLDLLPAPNPHPDLDILIAGLKNEPLALSLYQSLKRRLPHARIEVQVRPPLPTRSDFLHLLNRTRIAVLLPLPADKGAEGFYLPALEAMALKKLVVCPYAVGNADFCLPGVTCLQPDYNEASLSEAIFNALAMTDTAQASLIRNGWEISRRHSLEQERQAYLSLLNQIDELWQQPALFRS